MEETTQNKSLSSKLLVVFYVLIVIWWITIFTRGINETNENYFYSLVYGLIPLFWGIAGLVNSKHWGGISSTVGKGILFLSLGITCWGIGNLVFAYYNLALQIPVPYPSFADAGFILLYPFTAIGIYFLSKATGITYALKKLGGKIGLLVIPILMIVISYYFLFVVARGGVISYDGDLLKLILDIAFPVGSVIIISMAVGVYWLSREYLGGVFRKPILLILFGFLLAYITDFSYSYTTTTETFFVGNWVDLLYPTTFFVIAWGLSRMNPKLIFRDKNSNINSQ